MNATERHGEWTEQRILYAEELRDVDGLFLVEGVEGQIRLGDA